jgi:single-stranded-DNA-specific exonuclease
LNFKWHIPGKAQTMPEILNYIMKERNFNKEEMLDFIKNKPIMHDPFLFRDMQKVINRIKLAIENKETICIIGDYDCDGVTSTYTMFLGLRHMGANVIYKLPHRLLNGYGLKNALVDYAKEQNASLIITVDNGIAAPDAVNYAKQMGIDVIVTDHHEPQEVLPDCLTINPKVDKSYPFNDLCGCGVAFKVISALVPDFQETHLYDELLEIAAIGTVADAVTLVNENRTIVLEGLKRLNQTSNFGLKQLFELSGSADKQVNSDTIGFFLGPNINAAGRLESPDIALKLLLADDAVEAEKQAKALIKLNERRKILQKRAVKDLDVNPDDGCIITLMDETNAGIGGIVAAKIVDIYKKPCFVLHGNKEIVSGSGRTFGDFNIMDCVTKHLDIVEGGGGHKAACGISIKKDRIEEFRESCSKEFAKWLEENPDGLSPTLNTTCEITPDNINKKLIANIDKLKPFGNGNSEPVFMTKGIEVASYKVVGKNQNVIQFVLRSGFFEFKAVGFESLKDKYLDAGCPKEIDIVYGIGLNEFPAGTFTIQLSIQDFRTFSEEKYY